MSIDGVKADVATIVRQRQQLDDAVDEVRERAADKLAKLEDDIRGEYERARALAVEVDHSKVDAFRATSRELVRQLDRIADL